MYDNNNDPWATTFKDMMLLIGLSLLSMLLIVIPFLNDPKKGQKNEIQAPGNVIIEIYWDDALKDDIDGWVKGPKDRMPVGFNHRNDIQFNLLRDDLGIIGDISGRNYENFYARGIIPGEYIFNVVLFKKVSKKPIKVKVIVSVVKDGNYHQVLTKEVFLSTEKEEQNVFIFQLDKNGNVDPDTVYTDPGMFLYLDDLAPSVQGREDLE